MACSIKKTAFWNPSSSDILFIFHSINSLEKCKRQVVTTTECSREAEKLATNPDQWGKNTC